MKFINEDDDGSIFLTAPVMIPNTLDCDAKNGEPPLKPEQIEAFKESYDKYGFVDHEHGLTRDGRKIGTPSKSIILDQDTTVTIYDGTVTTYPEGTWLLTTHITDDEAISEAKKGYYTGYSASILPRESADKYLAALKAGKGDECSCKNQISSMGNSLIKDVPNPVVLSVSLTRSPCLHESKFCEVNNMDEDVSLKSKILNAMGMSEEAEVESLKSEMSELKGEIEEMKAGFNESLKSMQDEFKTTLEDSLKLVSEKAKETKPKEPETKPKEPEEGKKQVAEKGASKAKPIHDNIKVEKSKPQNIYKALGRNPDGTRRK